MPIIIKGLDTYSTMDLLFYGSTITFMLIIVRLIWIYPTAYLPRKLFPFIAKKDPMPSWQVLFTIGWAGMRGIVSLAAVLAIPLTEAKILPGAHLHLLVFITYFVIAATLVIPAITLPTLIRVLKLVEPANKTREEALGRVQMLEEAVVAITKTAEEENIPKPILDEFMRQYDRKRKIVEAQLSETPYSVISDQYFIFKKLFAKAIAAERSALLSLRKMGQIHDEIFWNLSNELDIEEMRTKNGLI